MAAHKVKCFYCDHVFDTNKEPWVKVNNRRYAHENCYNRANNFDDQVIKDKQALEEYIKQLFGYTSLPEAVNRQIKQYFTEKNYTYSGMLKSLVYYYEIRHGDKEKAFGRVGIIPFIYEDAYRYYYAIWEAQQRVKNTVVDLQEIPTKVIHINSPERAPMINKRKLFSFLEEEDE